MERVGRVGCFDDYIATRNTSVHWLVDNKYIEISSNISSRSRPGLEPGS
jgi:hypothetical protein